jgi:hypothetical protein
MPNTFTTFTAFAAILAVGTASEFSECKLQQNTDISGNDLKSVHDIDLHACCTQVNTRMIIKLFGLITPCSYACAVSATFYLWGFYVHSLQRTGTKGKHLLSEDERQSRYLERRRQDIWDSFTFDTHPGPCTYTPARAYACSSTNTAP